MAPWINPTAARDMLNMFAAFVETGGGSAALVFYDRFGRTLLTLALAADVFRAAERTLVQANAALAADTPAERSGTIDSWKLIGRNGQTALAWPADAAAFPLLKLNEGVSYNLSGFLLRLAPEGTLIPSVLLTATADPGA